MTGLSAAAWTLRSDRLWAAPVALLTIFVLDRIATSGRWPLVTIGLLDEPAHLLTAALVLSALPPGLLAPGFILSALLGSVLIDLDHVPLYTWAPDFAVDGGRPPTHSFVTVAVLLIAGIPIRPIRGVLLGLAAGVVLHFVRDVATGPGLALLWPAVQKNVLVPYWIYATFLALVVCWLQVRLIRERSAGKKRGRATTGAP